MNDMLYVVILTIASIMAAIPWGILALQDYGEQKFGAVGVDIAFVITSLACAVSIFMVI